MKGEIKTDTKEEYRMTKETVAYVIEKTKELMAAASCSKETKAAAQAWLDAIGTANEAEETKKYIAELEADIMPIDGLISFAGSDMGTKVFGADMAQQVLAHAQDIKAQGAAYCDCPACAAVKAILDKKADIL